eukprot:Nitzschia sp. Nitz4//scaffold69_size99277//14106//17060//NITZ4_004620-RA/size99277-augustus-gene-0.9-mRNA-1//-1//CDS//3329556676//6549//frame0
MRQLVEITKRRWTMSNIPAWSAFAAVARRWESKNWNWVNEELLDSQKIEATSHVAMPMMPDTPTMGPPRREATIAACFCRDYEAGRPPTFPSNLEQISNGHIRIYNVLFSSWWSFFGIYPATALLFVSYFRSNLWTVLLHSYAILIFLVDISMRDFLFSRDWFVKNDREMEFRIQQAFQLFLLIFGLQGFVWFLFADPPSHFTTLIISFFKPIVFFYLSTKARDTLEALLRVARILTLVVAMELFLILAFAAVACRLYYNNDHFKNLSTSWLSLFQLSTTVVNPSLWLPTYQQHRINALFFVVFIVVCTFYLHSLTLSVVFQVFIQAATEIHQRSASNKEASLQAAFFVLSSFQAASNYPTGKISMSALWQTIQQLRPHYSTIKINVLKEHVDPGERQQINYDDFRTLVPNVLNISVRTARHVSLFARGVEMLSLLVTVINFLFVIMLTSQFRARWFKSSVVVAGSLITFFSIMELGMRCDITKMTYFPMTRLSGFFDSFAAIGAVVSFYGLVSYVAGSDSGLDYLYAGRAIDMIRTMRFFAMFRDVVERSMNVLPALAGPVQLVVATIHGVVTVGMILWGNQIDVDDLAQNENVANLYYLNNFNSYCEGLVTVFNVLVINDWHEISNVFLYANRFSQPLIVYPLFVFVVLVAVCIILNVITAFFVETFVTRLSTKDMETDGILAVPKSRGEFKVPRAKPKAPPHSFTRQASWQSLMVDEPIRQTRSSASTESGEVLQFDVFERQGFDRIMESMVNSSGNQEQIAECLCQTLSLVSGVVSSFDVEYLVCCQPSMKLYPTATFRTMIAEFLDDFTLHSMIGEFSVRLMDPQGGHHQSRPSQRFIHPIHANVVLELTAFNVQNAPNIILFVARRQAVQDTTDTTTRT